MEIKWDTLISPVTPPDFEREHFARKILRLSSRALPVCGLETLEGWRSMLAGQPARRQGQRVVVDIDPSSPAGALTPEVEALLDQGGPLIVNGVHLVNPVVHEIAAAVGVGLGGSAVVNGYISPARKDALDLHADDHEVVVLQLHGHKQWIVGSRIVRGLAHSSLFVIDNAAVSQQARASDQFQTFDLAPDELLYLPRGLAHRATARDGVSIHLSVGVFRATGLDFSEFVLRQLIAEVAARDYIAHPELGADHPKHKEYMDLMAERLASLARDETLREAFLERQRRGAKLGTQQGTKAE
jgi:hypothetical protein